jgi:hypothetical protein
MTAFQALEALNIEICKKTGAGKGLATTPEAARAYREELYRRREEFAAAIAAARAELGAGASRGNAAFIDGCEHMLASTTRP